ncbi:hypothetical protein [Burkholderia anthina]|uniref:hypothetical protein n=1 Tax=Burkholderia anthina TaxID=179879 RepID=UPI00158A1B52|nr:hypothetical protein [Burkholderia anthina]
MKTTIASVKAKIARRPWTQEETDLLTEISRKHRVLFEETHLFPGRTFSALKCRSNRMGLIVHRCRVWTPEEDGTIRKMYASNSSIKSRLHLLPNRSYESVKSRATKLGVAGTKPPVTDGSLSTLRTSIISLLSLGERMTAEAIAGRLGYSLHAVRDCLHKWRGEKFYVASWVRVGLHGQAAEWLDGNKPDSPRPPQKDPAQSRREYKRRKKIAASAFNPWLVRAAPESVLSAQTGRVFKQDMTVDWHDDIEVSA